MKTLSVVLFAISSLLFSNAYAEDQNESPIACEGMYFLPSADSTAWEKLPKNEQDKIAGCVQVVIEKDLDYNRQGWVSDIERTLIEREHGIGIKLGFDKDGYVIITKVFKDTEASGHLCAGEQVTKVNGSKIVKLETQFALNEDTGRDYLRLVEQMIGIGARGEISHGVILQVNHREQLRNLALSLDRGWSINRVNLLKAYGDYQGRLLNIQSVVRQEQKFWLDGELTSRELVRYGNLLQAKIKNVSYELMFARDEATAYTQPDCPGMLPNHQD